jgi:MFS family permease
MPEMDAQGMAPEPTVPQGPAAQPRGPLRSFAFRDFRFIWAGALFWAVASWMQRIAVAWLILTLTDSAIFVTLAFAVYALPALVVGPFGGALADRLNRKYLMLWVQVFSAAITLLLALMVMSGLENLWVVFGLVLLLGSGLPLQYTCGQTLIYDVVGPRNALNGVSLWSVGLRSVGALGAILGGVVIEYGGIGTAIILSSIGYGLAAVSTAFIQHPGPSGERPEGSVLQNLGSGFKLVAGSGILLPVLMLAIVAEAFGYGMLSVFPILADEGVYGVGAIGLGLMNGAFGVGGVVGAMFLAALPDLSRKGAALIGVMVVTGLLLVALSFSSVFGAALAVIAGMGMVLASYDALAVLLMQDNAPDGMRGRATGTLVLTFGIGPVGPVALGLMIDSISARAAIGIGAVVVLVATVVIAASAKKLRSG